MSIDQLDLPSLSFSSSNVLISGDYPPLHSLWILDNGAPSVGRANFGQRLHDILDFDCDFPPKIISAHWEKCTTAIPSGELLFVTTGSYKNSILDNEIELVVTFEGDIISRIPYYLLKSLILVKHESNIKYSSSPSSILGMPFNWLHLKDDISILSVAQKQLRTMGAVLIRNAPVDINSILVVASIFGSIQETNYGKVFDVKAETQPSNLAFSSAALSLHTDNPYRQPTPPGFQCLLCLQPAKEGGFTVFSDGFQAAKELERTNFESYKILTSTQVTYRYADKHSQLTSTRPVIELDSSFKTIKSLAVNNRSLAPLDPQHPELYKALADFQKLLNDKQYGFSIKLEKGDFIIWDNFRILHGRSSYELGTNEDTQRHLQGCYLTRDSVLSNAAVLIDR